MVSTRVTDIAQLTMSWMIHRRASEGPLGAVGPS